MNSDTFKRILGNLSLICQSELSEIQLRSEENLQWLSDISSELEKQTSKSNVLLPKTPTVKRKQRKRCPVATIPEDGEIEDITLSEMTISPSNSYQTRSTRSTRQNSERVSPVLSKRSKRNASKVASKKIKQQINITLNGKMRQSPTDWSSSVRQGRKRISSGVILEEDLQPQKYRRLEREKSAQPLDEQLENSSTVLKTPEVSCLTQDVRNVKSVSPVVVLLRISSDTNRTYDNRNKEEIKLLDSPDHVTSSVCDESPKRQEEKQKSFTSYPSHAVPSSTVSTETTPKALPSIPVDVTVKFTEDDHPSKSVHSSYVHRVDSLILDEPQRSKLSIHSLPNNFSDKIENNNIVTTINPLCGDKHPEPSNSDTESCAVRSYGAMHQSAMEGKLSGKRTSVDEIGVSGLNSTFTKAPENQQSDDVCAKVLNVDQPDKANESVSEHQVTLHSRLALQSSPNKKMAKPKKSSQMFSPFANEPVRQRVAAFEKLHTVSEEPAEQIVQKKPEQTMRLTRTKTRAMARAAAAESAGTNQGVVHTSAGVTNTVSSDENKWKASRKSVAKAKRISLARELREKEKIEEHELSKENSMSTFSASKFTPHGLYIYDKYRQTPLSSSNISNTSVQSAFTAGSSSKGRFLVNRQLGNIVFGVESFIPKLAVKPALDIQEKREEEIKRRIEKEEAARKMRDQKVKEKVEEKKRKREEKMLKVLKAREALERQKQDMELRTQKEKEEKSKQAMQDREDKMKEHVQQKKQYAQQKAAEIEERRKQEEAARLAKLKEQEEEQRRLQAARKKEQEEAERQYLKRLAEEKEAAILREQQAAKMAQWQAKLKEKQTKEKTEAKLKTVPGKVAVMDKTFDMSQPNSSLSKQSPTKKKIPNVNNYGIDSSAEECSEDEERPKRPIPLWARKKEHEPVLKRCEYKLMDIYRGYFICKETTPDLAKIFGIKFVKRTSSAVWRTPPRYSTLPKY
ncbi:inner centromere protein A isoform X2 [Zootermopsis nevadensis]|nr:inner centromere protein A isoform X2 [Zootermopsis nevadensis]XP_021923971.1 inner centromere protein A isoform X2 [Zootermopsis nevadensis]